MSGPTTQHKVAYRASYSGPAQVIGGPGTGKTVVALHRVRHLLKHLRDGDRILLTTYTNALVAALRAGLAAPVEDEELRGRVDITTVDAFASRVVSTSRRPLRGGEEEHLWEQAARATGFTGTTQFLAQEYKHVIQKLRSNCERENTVDLARPAQGRLSVEQRVFVRKNPSLLEGELVSIAAERRLREDAFTPPTCKVWDWAKENGWLNGALSSRIRKLCALGDQDFCRAALRDADEPSQAMTHPAVLERRVGISALLVEERSRAAAPPRSRSDRRSGPAWGANVLSSTATEALARVEARNAEARAVLRFWRARFDLGSSVQDDGFAEAWWA